MRHSKVTFSNALNQAILAKENGKETEAERQFKRITVEYSSENKKKKLNQEQKRRKSKRKAQKKARRGK